MAVLFLLPGMGMLYISCYTFQELVIELKRGELLMARCTGNERRGGSFVKVNITRISLVIQAKRRNNNKTVAGLITHRKCLHNYVFLAIVSPILSVLFFSYRPSSLNMIIIASSGTCVSNGTSICDSSLYRWLYLSKRFI